MRISVFFAPVSATPGHIAIADELGFHSAWVYDSPLLYADPFVTLALSAERTSRIGLGIGVLVPGLRAPVATASALRHIASLAPGRLRVAVGAGFTGRFTLGLGPVGLQRLEAEVDALRAFVNGEEWAHGEGGRPVRPIPVPGAPGDTSVPIYVACRGVRAQALARRIGDGAMTGIFYPGGLGLVREALGPGIPMVVHAVGSVADPGEHLDSPRLAAAVGPVVGVAFHAFAEQPWRIEGLDPELRRVVESYLASVNARLPPGRRHQELHRGHLVALTLPEDDGIVTPENVRRFSLTGTVDELRQRLAELARAGVDEVAIQPGGDIPSELRRLASALL